MIHPFSFTANTSCDLRRRLVLAAGGGAVLSAMLPLRARAAGEIEIAMAGAGNGAHVWFRPRGLWLQPGQSVRWVNREAGNVHTVTAYHPANGKPLRMPEGAEPWNSGYLMPDESFVRAFDKPGVYDYFCIPHEQAGMVGRIVVGDADASGAPYAETDALLSAAAVAGFPGVADIVRNRQVA